MDNGPRSVDDSSGCQDIRMLDSWSVDESTMVGGLHGGLISVAANGLAARTEPYINNERYNVSRDGAVLACHAFAAVSPVVAVVVVERGRWSPLAPCDQCHYKAHTCQMLLVVHGPLAKRAISKMHHLCSI